MPFEFCSGGLDLWCSSSFESFLVSHEPEGLLLPVLRSDLHPFFSEPEQFLPGWELL